METIRGTYEWNVLFREYNAKRMRAASLWHDKLIANEYLLDKRLLALASFEDERPLPEKRFVKLLNWVNEIAVYLYGSRPSTRADGVADALSSSVDVILDHGPVNGDARTNGYDWFVFTGRMTEALINLHVSLCVYNTRKARTEPQFVFRLDSEYSNRSTERVYRTLLAVCETFTTSLKRERVSSNAVCVASAFLYGSALRGATSGDHGPHEFIGRLLRDSRTKYDVFRDNVVGRVNRANFGRSASWPEDDLDGIYYDRSFIAHKRLRMYAYIRPYCEQLYSIDAFLSAVDEKLLNDETVNALLRAVEPFWSRDKLYYFNLHSRSGTFGYKTGSNAFRLFGSHYLRDVNDRDLELSDGERPRGKVYVADKAKLVFIDSDVFTCHAMGHDDRLAIGEIDRYSRTTNVIYAWSMGMRPLFTCDEDTTDVPGPFELEPCVVDTSPFFGYSDGGVKPYEPRFRLARGRNTTNYVAVNSRSSVSAVDRVGVSACEMADDSMDVRFKRFTVLTPLHVFTVFTEVARDRTHRSREPIRVSAYTANGPCDDLLGPTSIRGGGGVKRYSFGKCDVVVYHGCIDSPSENVVETSVTRGIPFRRESKCRNKSSLANLSVILNDTSRVSRREPLVIGWLPKRQHLPSDAVDLIYDGLNGIVPDCVEFADGNVGSGFTTPCKKWRVYVDGNACVVSDLHDKNICVADYGTLDRDGYVTDVDPYARYLAGSVSRITNDSRGEASLIGTTDVIYQPYTLLDYVVANSRMGVEYPSLTLVHLKCVNRRVYFHVARERPGTKHKTKGD